MKTADVIKIVAIILGVALLGYVAFKLFSALGDAFKNFGKNFNIGGGDNPTADYNQAVIDYYKGAQAFDPDPNSAFNQFERAANADPFSKTGYDLSTVIPFQPQTLDAKLLGYN